MVSSADQIEQPFNLNISSNPPLFKSMNMDRAGRQKEHDQEST